MERTFLALVNFNKTKHDYVSYLQCNWTSPCKPSLLRKIFNTKSTTYATGSFDRCVCNRFMPLYRSPYCLLVGEIFGGVPLMMKSLHKRPYSTRSYRNERVVLFIVKVEVEQHWNFIICCNDTTHGVYSKSLDFFCFSAQSTTMRFPKSCA